MWLEMGIIIVLFILLLLVGTKDPPTFYTTKDKYPALIELENPDAIKLIIADVVRLGSDSWNEWIDPTINSTTTDTDAEGSIGKIDNIKSPTSPPITSTSPTPSTSPTTTEKDKSKRWMAFPLLEFGKWSAKNCALCSNTHKLLEHIPGIVTAGFCKLDANTVLDKHEGWKDVSKIVLRSHMQLTKNKPDSCTIWVNKNEKPYEHGKWITFDDSLTHSATNKDGVAQIVLVVDFQRP